MVHIYFIVIIITIISLCFYHFWFFFFFSFFFVSFFITVRSRKCIKWNRERYAVITAPILVKFSTNVQTIHSRGHINLKKQCNLEQNGLGSECIRTNSIHTIQYISSELGHFVFCAVAWGIGGSYGNYFYVIATVLCHMFSFVKMLLQSRWNYFHLRVLCQCLVHN